MRRVCEIAGIDVDDGVVFDVSGVRRASIREDGHYTGVRVTMPAALGRARVNAVPGLGVSGRNRAR